VSAVSFSVFVLALMAVTDPVTASVLGNFRPHTCVITETFRNSGATVCENWSSCKNLCAHPPVLYTCVHIYVRVFALDNDTATNSSEVKILIKNLTTLQKKYKNRSFRRRWTRGTCPSKSGQ